MVSARRWAKYLRLLQGVRRALRFGQVADDAEDAVGRELNHPRLKRSLFTRYLQAGIDGLRLAGLDDPAKSRPEDRRRVRRQDLQERLPEKHLRRRIGIAGSVVVEESAVAVLDEHQVGQRLENRPRLGFARLQRLVGLPPLRFEERPLREDVREFGDRRGVALEARPRWVPSVWKNGSPLLEPALVNAVRSARLARARLTRSNRRNAAINVESARAIAIVG